MGRASEAQAEVVLLVYSESESAPTDSAVISSTDWVRLHCGPGMYCGIQVVVVVVGGGGGCMVKENRSCTFFRSLSQKQK